MEIVRLGVVGLGKLGREHAANICYNITKAELAAVCSDVPEEVERIMKEMKPGYGSIDYMELLNDKNLDGVVISSNSADCSRMICDAANAGVENIFCETLMGMTLEEIDSIMEACDRNNVLIFQLGHYRRFERSLLGMKQKIDHGQIGKPIFIKVLDREAERGGEALSGKNYVSGDIVLGMLAHDYDVARFLIESDAENVCGMGGTLGSDRCQEIDHCIVSVEFDNGVIGCFEAARNSSYGYHLEIEVYGTKGCIKMSTLQNESSIISMSTNGATADFVNNSYEFWKSSLIAEIQDFADCIQNGNQPWVGLNDGCNAVKLTLAVKESIDKRMIIKMK